ncbi:MAG: hypothetical protein ACXVBE_05865 [Bdellovibrionota bacterium]
MKKVCVGIFLVLAFFLSPLANAAGEFNGHWQGVGTFQSEDLPKAIPADFDVTIKAGDKHLIVDECWVMQTASGGKRKTCYHSDYAVNENDQVFAGQNKIGDIYPDRISIYQGDSQVSELMTFDLNGKRELLFRYAYSNMDGNIVMKFAQLPEVTNK